MSIDIDIELPEALREALKQPVCADLRLPKPVIPQIAVPNGAIIKPVADFTKGIPDDCSMNFNLILQLQPIMASIECLMRVLALIEPLTELLKALTKGDLLTAGQTLPDFLAAFDKLKDCLGLINPVSIIAFIRDILLLVARLLRCLVERLRSVVELTTQLAINIKTAEENGDTGTAEVLQCAMENADLTTQGLLSSVESLGALLSLLGPFLDLSGQDIEIPSLDTGAGTEDLIETLDTLEAIAQGLEDLAISLGAEG
jgi:hypothetical protein